MEEDLKTTLNRQTAKADWETLAPVFAMGSMIAVKAGIDLIDVAAQVAENNIKQVQSWKDNGTIFTPDDKQALRWHEQQAVLWAVVVKPWVLVQEAK